MSAFGVRTIPVRSCVPAIPTGGTKSPRTGRHQRRSRGDPNLTPAGSFGWGVGKCSELCPLHRATTPVLRADRLVTHPAHAHQEKRTGSSQQGQFLALSLTRCQAVVYGFAG